MFKKSQRAIGLAEYVIFLTIIATVVTAMTVYVRRGIQAKIKDMSDVMLPPGEVDKGLYQVAQINPLQPLSDAEKNSVSDPLYPSLIAEDKRLISNSEMDNLLKVKTQVRSARKGEKRLSLVTTENVGIKLGDENFTTAKSATGYKTIGDPSKKIEPESSGIGVSQEDYTSTKPTLTSAGDISTQDTDGDGVPDRVEDGAEGVSTQDTDGDGILDWIEETDLLCGEEKSAEIDGPSDWVQEEANRRTEETEEIKTEDLQRAQDELKDKGLEEVGDTVEEALEHPAPVEEVNYGEDKNADGTPDAWQ